MNHTLQTLFRLFVALLFVPDAAAQALLTPEDAVRIALENNFAIRLSAYDADIARLNNTKANAGMLPQINLVANETFTLSAFQQELANGNEFTSPGAPFNNFNAGVQLSWTLFDGRRMFIAKRRLEALETLGERQLQLSVMQTTASVLAQYYLLAQSRMQEKALAEVIALNEERLRIAEARLAAGMAPQTEALQARIDLNQRRADLLLQQNATLASRRALNTLLARDPDTPFSAYDTVQINYAPNPQALLDAALAQNPQLLALRQNAIVAALAADEARTLSAPRLIGLSQFNALRTDNGAGFLRSNSQAGLSLGLAFAMPLYTGGDLRRQAEVAKLQALQSKTLSDERELIIKQELAQSIADYELQRQLLALEEANILTARENLAVSTERFRLGQTTSLETQQAQASLEQSLARRNQLLLQLKNTEIGLRLLSGDL